MTLIAGVDPGKTGALALIDRHTSQLVAIRQQPWRQHAACRGVGPALFYTQQHDMATQMTTSAICQDCPVRAECRQAGRNEQHGIWGGVGGRGSTARKKAA